MFEGPEKKFQRHIADYFIREHQYALLEQDEITDTEYYFAEDHLVAFLKATQKETFESFETNYGTDAGDIIFRAHFCRHFRRYVGHRQQLYFEKK